MRLCLLVLLLLAFALADRTPTYDYIVIGAGTAGCPVTAKLLDAGFSVLLVEAGDLVVSREIQFDRMAPRLTFELWDTPESAYNFQSEEDRLGNRYEILHGKGFGGTTLINAGLYSRPNPSEFDNWHIQGWDSQTILNEFIAQENVIDNPLPGVQGTSGPLTIRFPKTLQTNTIPMLNAFTANGFNYNQQSDSGEHHPFDVFESRIILNEIGARFDAFSVYVAPRAQNPLLTISGSTVASKILYESYQGTMIATGVELRSGSRHWTVYANKEVIVSAGVFESPKLLMLSGIGDASYLASMGITAQVNQPNVGKNLIPRPLFVLAYTGVQTLPDQDFTQLNNQTAINEFLAGEGGFFAVPINALAGYGAITPSSSEIDYLFQFTDTEPFFYTPVPSAQGLACLVGQIKSRGSIGLRSTNPFDRPAVNLNFYSDAYQQDLASMISCVTAMRAVANSAEGQALLGSELFPGVADSLIPETVLSNSQYAYHAFGSNSMGNDSANSVVDHNLIVHGFANLRVIDGSIIPQAITSGLVMTTFLIGNLGGKLVVNANYTIPIDFTNGYNFVQNSHIRLINDPVQGTSANQACQSVYSSPFSANDPHLTCYSQEAVALLNTAGVSEAFVKTRGFICDTLTSSGTLNQGVDCSQSLPVLCNL